MAQLLPDRLKSLWQRVESGQLTAEVAQLQQEQLLAEYRAIWTAALLRNGDADLKHGLLDELAVYLRSNVPAEIEARCLRVGEELKADWQRIVKREDRSSIEQFYDRSQAYLFDLTWWHTLETDLTPLAYVLALDFAGCRPVRRYLDFGAGVGSGGILFARHGFDVTLADISPTLLRFSEWRLAQRVLPAHIVDLKTGQLPDTSFDMITAMDVFEHLADPVDAVERLAAALKPGGYLFGRFAAEPDSARPQHIVFDFEPTFRRLSSLGFMEVWRDEWLWGHQVFQKPL